MTNSDYGSINELDTAVASSDVVHYLNKASRLSEEGRYAEALDALKDAFMYARDEDVAIVERREEKIREQQKAQAQELEAQIRALLEQDKPDLDRAEQLLVQLERVVAPEWPNLGTLRGLVTKQRRAVEASERADELRRELGRLWGRPWPSDADEALRLAQRAASEYPDDPTLTALLDEARKHREKVYKQEVVWTTAAAEGNFEYLKEAFEAEIAAGKGDLPWYEWDESAKKLVPLRMEPADAARKHLLDLAAAYDQAKAHEKLEQARAEMPQSPPLAQALLQEALALRHLYDSPLKVEVQNYLEEVVQPAVEKQNEVKKRLSDARSLPDARRAWQAVQQCEIEDPYAPSLDPVKKALRPRLRKTLEQDLRDLENERQAGQPDVAQEAAQEIRRLVEEDSLLSDVTEAAQALIEQCQEDQNLLQLIKDERAVIVKLMETDLNAAEISLQSLEHRVEGRPERFVAPVEDLRTLLESKRGLDNVVRRLESRMLAADTLEILDKVEAARKRESRKHKDPMEDLERRIKARRAFLEGKLALQEKLFTRALECLEQVVDLTGDDQEAVERLLEGVRPTEKDEKAVAEAIESAKQFRSLKTEKGYRQALELLKRWLDKPTTKRVEIIQLEHAIRREWETQVDNRLQTMTGDEGHPLLSEIERLILEILDEELKSSLAPRWKSEALPKVYRGLAETEHDRKRYDEALKCWDKALIYTDKPEEISAGRQKTRKEQVFRRVEELRDKKNLAAVQQELEDLVQDYLDDMDCRCRLAEVCAEQGKYDLALRHVNAGRRYLMNISDEGQQRLWREQLDSLASKILDEKDLNETKEHIQQSIEPDGGMGNYRQAGLVFQRLLDRHPEQKEGLNRWYDDLRRRTLRELNSQLVALRGQQEGYETLQSLAAHLAQEGDSQLARTEVETIEATISQLPQDQRLRFALELLKAGLDKPGNEKFISEDGWALAQRLAELHQETVRARWRMAAQMLALHEHREARQIINDEVLLALTNLVRNVDDACNDSRGPRADQDGQEVPPERALSYQIRQAEQLQSQAELINSVFNLYAWARGEKDEVQGLASQATDQLTKTNELLKQLTELRRKIMAVEELLATTVAAGNRADNHWGQVDWKAITTEIVRSVAPEESWQEREGWWDRVHDTLRQAWLSSNLQKVDWVAANSIITQTGIEEKWEAIDELLPELGGRFGEHRTVRALQKQVEEARQTRRRLIVHVVELLALVNVEDFRGTLDKLKEIERLDPQDAYGFRGRLRIVDPYEEKPLPLQGSESLLAQTERKLKQWQALERWVLPVKQQSFDWSKAREQITAHTRCAEYDDALDLCRDALDGLAGEGLTKTFGGKWSLHKITTHLNAAPQELQSGALSHRVSKVLRQVEFDRLAVTKDIREAESLCQPQNPGSIPAQVAKWKGYQSWLDTAIGRLGRIPSRPWTRREKENLRTRILDRIEEAKGSGIAPDWPGWTDYRNVVENT